MVTHEASASGQNPAYRPTHRHPSFWIGIGHLLSGAKSLAVLLRQLSAKRNGFFDEAEQQGEIEALGIGYIVDIDSNGLAHDCAEQRWAWHQALMVGEHHWYKFGSIESLCPARNLKRPAWRCGG